MVQEQTRRRIESETTSPSGAAWKPNRTGTPILVRSGALQRSVDYAVTGTEAIVGSGLVYARIQQKGGTIKPKTARRLVFRLGNRIVFAPKVTLPARPYLGLSPENREDILDQVGRFLRARIGGGA
jgi:phage gpG-like protein